MKRKNHLFKNCLIGIIILCMTGIFASCSIDDSDIAGVEDPGASDTGNVVEDTTNTIEERNKETLLQMYSDMFSGDPALFQNFLAQLSDDLTFVEYGPDDPEITSLLPFGEYHGIEGEGGFMEWMNVIAREERLIGYDVRYMVGDGDWVDVVIEEHFQRYSNNADVRVENIHSVHFDEEGKVDYFFLLIDTYQGVASLTVDNPDVVQNFHSYFQFNEIDSAAAFEREKAEADILALFEAIKNNDLETVGNYIGENSRFTIAIDRDLGAPLGGEYAGVDEINTLIGLLNDEFVEMTLSERRPVISNGNKVNVHFDILGKNGFVSDAALMFQMDEDFKVAACCLFFDSWSYLDSKVLEPGEAEGKVIEHAEDQHEAYTDIAIEATPEQIWAVLTDFENMPNWSSSLQGIEGDFRNGGAVTSLFFFGDQVAPFPHTLVLEDGVSFGWSDELLTMPGIRDNHHYIVGETDGSLTRFIQTDTLTGVSEAGTTEDMANLLLPVYMAFNAELRAEVERRYTSLDFQALDTNPDATLIYEAVVQTTGMEAFGVDPNDVFSGAVAIPEEGIRMNATFAGTTAGLLEGNLSGIDYMTCFPDGSVRIDAEGVIETTDGHRVALHVDGETRPRAGTYVSDITETATLTTNAAPYLWLNDQYIVGVGTGDLSTNTLNLRLYGFEEDPFAGNPPYQKAPTPDYENFPFDSESLENNPECVLNYEATLQTGDVTAFGVDPAAVLAGTEPIPEEGIRMNVEFTGAANGDLTGDISGVDYLTILPDGRVRIYVHATIVTQEGYRVALHANGMSIPRPEAPGISDIFESAAMRTDAEPLGYLNGLHIVGIGTWDQLTSSITLRVCGFEDDHFASH